MYKIRLTLLSIAFLVFITACGASVKMLGSWVDETKPEYKVEDVLVIGISRENIVRNLWENTFSELLEKERVSVNAYNRIAGKEVEMPTGRGSILAAVKKTKAKTVLITRAVEIDKKTKTLSGFVHYQPAPYYSGMYDYYGLAYTAVYTPPRDVTKMVVHLETNLYDVATEKLIWSAQTEAVDAKLLKTDFAKIAKSLVQDLRAKKLL